MSKCGSFFPLSFWAASSVIPCISCRSALLSTFISIFRASVAVGSIGLIFKLAVVTSLCGKIFIRIFKDAILTLLPYANAAFGLR